MLNFIFEPLFVHAPDIIILEISSRYIHSLIKYVDIVNAELIESTLKQTIMCSFVLMIFYGSRNIKNVAVSNIY